MLEPLAALLQRFRAEDDEPAEVAQASLAEALSGGNDPLRIVDYFGQLGIPVSNLDDLLRINEDQTEEELHSFRVQEGVAVSVASVGIFVLYTP